MWGREAQAQDQEAREQGRAQQREEREEEQEHAAGEEGLAEGVRGSPPWRGVQAPGRGASAKVLAAAGPSVLVALNVLLALSLYPAVWVVPAAFYAGSGAVMPYPIALGSAVGVLGVLPLAAALIDVRGSLRVPQWRRGSLRSMMLSNTYAQGMVACFLSFIAPAVFALLLQSDVSVEDDGDGPIGGVRIYEGLLPYWLLLLHFLFQLLGFTASAVLSTVVLFII